MSLNELNRTFLEIWGYPMSYLELFGTLSGLLTVWLAAKAHVLTWPTGLVNNLAFFLIFYQVQLYSDMFLQIYFFVISLYGWWNWRRNANQPNRNITVLPTRQRLLLIGITITSVPLVGYGMSQIHLYFPKYLPQPASYPYADAFTAVLSIVATLTMAQKKIECWILWILVDVVSIGLYAMKDICLISLEYVIFLGICLLGLWQWTKLYANENRTSAGEVYAHPPGTP
jgi:nicotinamide mononucleotide transporter